MSSERRAGSFGILYSLLFSTLACAGGEAAGQSDAAVAGGMTGQGGAGAAATPGGSAAAGIGGQVGVGGTDGVSGMAAAAGMAPGGPSLGPAEFAVDELDAASDGGTITMQNIGAPGWYPSRREPASGMCDAISTGTCCLTKHVLADDKLSPWNEELIVTLRGPMQLKQFVVYEPSIGDPAAWELTSAWDSRDPGSQRGIAWDGEATHNAAWAGTVGSECLVDVTKDAVYACGSGSVPFCPAAQAGAEKRYGWSGSKLFVLTARMPSQTGGKIDGATACAVGSGGNWYNAPWIGLSHAELVRSGKFGDCHCYAKDPAKWFLADGCGQFNAFEVVNDNNDFQNFDVFSTNLFAYHGYVGQGPCGKACNLAGVGPADLVRKQDGQPALAGGLTTPEGGPDVAFRRPADGFRYVIILLDTETRTIQLAVIHPRKLPPAAAALLPALPEQLGRSAIDALVGMRLPH